MNPDNDFSDVVTLVHEFGHAANSSLVSPMQYNMDIAEIQSQGLQMLFSHKCDYVFGDETFAFDVYQLLFVVYSIVTGFSQDEFQQRAYTEEVDSLEDLDRLYIEVEAKYGISLGLNWYDVPTISKDRFTTSVTPYRRSTRWRSTSTPWTTTMTR